MVKFSLEINKKRGILCAVIFAEINLKITPVYAINADPSAEET